MRVVTVAILVVGVFASFPLARGGQSPAGGPSSTAGQPREREATNISKAVETYCAGCHNGVMRSPSKMLLDVFDTSRIAVDPDVWARAARQIQAGTMPPVGAARPDRATSDAMLTAIDAGLAAYEAPPAEPGQKTAARLAALLWNAAPDNSLRRDAERGLLNDVDTLHRQVRRMLADDRARSFVSRFFFPWLGLDQLGKADPDRKFFPDYDVSLRAAMARETEMFLLSQLRDDRDAVELWSAGYSFVNERLAKHYGIGNVKGSNFRRVATMPERQGLLGQGSILMVTSRHQHGPDAAYTSPAARATWVRWHFLGAPSPLPFPGAQPVKPELPITPQTRALPAEPCVNCHRNFFPLGYALEQFDPIGRWRTSDQAGPVDASGAFVDGSPTNGVVELRKVLLQRPDAFRTTITEKLVAYASGRPVGASKVTTDGFIRARQVLMHVPDTRWSSLIAAVVSTTPLPGP